MLESIFAVAFILSAVMNGMDLKTGLAFHEHTPQYQADDPLGTVHAETWISDDVSLYASHTSSIPRTNDNDGGLNQVGIAYTMRIKGLSK